MLEFLPARFEQPGAVTILSFSNKRITKGNKHLINFFDYNDVRASE